MAKLPARGETGVKIQIKNTSDSEKNTLAFVHVNESVRQSFNPNESPRNTANTYFIENTRTKKNDEEDKYFYVRQKKSFASRTRPFSFW